MGYFTFMKKARILSFILALSFNSVVANVSITEIMQSNFGGVIDYYNEFPDSWVEVHNSSEQDIDLKEYSISEVNDIDSAYTLPESFVVPANGYALIYCDKMEIKQHTDFRLNSDKPGTVYLWDNKGNLVDSLHYPEMISPEVSYGRLPDNPDSLSYFRIATPEKENNNTYTERVLKKVDFSVDGGVKKDPFYLKLSLKGDCPKDALIRYTTDGSEPTESSILFQDSIFISKTTVVRAKSFSDSAVSKISKTQTYLFDTDYTIPIVNVVCNPDYLYRKKIGIFSSSNSYYISHYDNPPQKSWMGDANYLYNWRRPVNVEYYSGDSSSLSLNQLAEIRVSGNESRENEVKSIVIYANKRFGEKHFNGAIWKELKPEIKKQKSLLIRNEGQNPQNYALMDMFVQTAIGRASKYFDVDYQAQRNVRFYINGKFQSVMHLQERDNEDFIWANHNKTSDVEILDFYDAIYYGGPFDTLHPNYVRLQTKFRSPNTTYLEMEEEMDINEFMNYLATQCFYENIDFPGNNFVIWYDKQKSKKWRWIMKDLDGAIYLSPYFEYYNYLLRKKPFDENVGFNNDEASELYQKMFSFGKFKDPYIDRSLVMGGSIFAKERNIALLDSILGEMSLELESSELSIYLENVSKYYDWLENHNDFYFDYMGRFFELKDTTHLTIKGLYKDSIIYINNNPLIGNQLNGYFYKERDLYLTHHDKLDIYGLYRIDTDNVTYLDLGKPIQTFDESDTRWTISYTLDGQVVVEHYANENLHYKIPVDAEGVTIVDGYDNPGSLSPIHSVSSRHPEELSYLVYTVEGVFVGKFNYAEICEFKQKDNVNIVVVVDSEGKKLYTIKMLKKEHNLQ